MSHTGGAFSASAHRLPLGLTRSVAAAIALPGAIAVLVLIAWRRRARSRDVDAVALLALLGLVRCVADPVPLQYNFVDLLIPLAAWEAVRLRRLPVTAYLATAAVWLTAGGVIHAAPSILSVLSLGWAIALGLYLVNCAFHGRAREVILDVAAIAPGRATGLIQRW
jgi:hypothetical protein